MPTTNGKNMAKLLTFPIDYPPVAEVGGRLRCFHEEITLATQPVADLIRLARLPRGGRFEYGMLTASVSLGTATLAIGVQGGVATKYRGAAVFTATDTPTPFGNAAAKVGVLAAEETIVATIGTAALPASGTLVVDIYYTMD